MSRAVEVADLDAAKSEIVFKLIGGKLVLEVTNMSVLYKNFSGKEINGYNSDHVRSFNLVLTDAQLLQLKDAQDEHGILFNVRSKEVFSEEDVKRGQAQRMAHFINVKVKYDAEVPSRNPMVSLYTPDRLDKSKMNVSSLNEKTIDLLDTTEIKRWDAQMSIYTSGNKFRKPKNGEAFCTLYLRKLKAEASYEEEFGGYWDDFDEKCNNGKEIMTASEVVDTEFVNPATGE